MLMGFQKSGRLYIKGKKFLQKSGCPYINGIPKKRSPLYKRDNFSSKSGRPFIKGIYFFFKKAAALILKGFQKSGRPLISGISKKRPGAVLSLLKGKRQGGFYFSKAICD